MDVFSHGLWGVAVSYPKYKKTPKKLWLAVLAGTLPDVIPFLPVQVYFLLKGFDFNPDLFFAGDRHWVFTWAVESYNYTHSLAIFFFALLLFCLFRYLKFSFGSNTKKSNADSEAESLGVKKANFLKKILGKNSVLFLPWGVHILMDIPTHPDFFQTPFLFPVSEWRFSWGVSWAEPWLFFGNWLALAVVFTIICVYHRKNKTILKPV